MKRINVIGTTGSGKTMFAKELSSVLDISYIQLDELFWKPNWQESTDKEFLLKVTKAVNEDCWILDGNFSRITKIKWQRADTVIWLDYSYSRNLTQLFFRTMRRAINKQELWPNTNNRESFKKSFFDKSSILLWFFQNYKGNREKYLKAMHSNDYPHIKFIRLTSPKAAQKFIKTIENNRV